MRSFSVKLRTRVGLYFLGIVAVWTIVVLVLIGDLLTEASQRFLRERGAQLARALVVQTVPLVYGEDPTALPRLLGPRTRPPSELRYIVVLGREGEVIWSSFPSGVPRSLLRVRHPTSLGSGVRVQLIEVGREQIYDYEAAESGIRLRVGMSLVALQALVHRAANYILWIGMSALLAVFAVALHVSRPVEALMLAVAQRARSGSQATPDGPQSWTQETSALADWFRTLIANLEEKTQQLDRSRKLAYLGEISTSIAHEVNNPLGVVVINSEFLAKRAARGEFAPAVAEEVERVRAGAMRATLAAQKLLQFARYSTQQKGIKRRQTRAEHLIRETVELLHDRIHLAECTVDLVIQPELPTVSLDAQGIQQVLFNLLTNALDASKPGGALVVRVEVRDGWFTLAVADQGSGMDPALLARVREPFVTTKEPGKGTGLGLAISDAIVRQHGGELVLESKVGEGTTVTVRVPVGVPP